MSSPRPVLPRAPGGRRGFTLVEILLVLALIGLMGAVLIGGATRLLDVNKETDPESALLSLLQKMRGQAVETGQIVELTQLPENKGFLWGADGLEVLPSRPGGPVVTIVKPQVDRVSLIGGQMVEESLERMRFYPDGACDPVRIQVRKGDARRVYAIDPWTAAPLPDGGKAS